MSVSRAPCLISQNSQTLVILVCRPGNFSTISGLGVTHHAANPEVPHSQWPCGLVYREQLILSSSREEGTEGEFLSLPKKPQAHHPHPINGQPLMGTALLLTRVKSISPDTCSAQGAGQESRPTWKPSTEVPKWRGLGRPQPPGLGFLIERRLNPHRRTRQKWSICVADVRFWVPALEWQKEKKR